MEHQYELLSAAIIERALLDYRRAKKNICKKYDVLQSESRIREIQKFLKSNGSECFLSLTVKSSSN